MISLINHFTIVFLCVLATNALVQWWLANRHLRHVLSHRNEVPEAFADNISLETHQSAADYTVAKVRVGMLDYVIGTVLLLLWTLGGGLDLLNGLWRDLALSPVWAGSGFILSAFFIFGLLDLPMSAYRTFVIEERFGFNKTTVGVFLIDLVKQGLVLLALGLPLVTAILWLMHEAGRFWWLYAWCLWAAFSVLLMWLYPIVIAPLFNKFSPLDNHALEARISALLERNGLNMQGVFVMDGSRRSGHGNAYFTGIGANKRIVFFDTLLDGLDDEEVEAVLAHEVGHFKKRHIRKQILVRMALSLVGLAVLGWLVDQSWFYHGLGVSEPSLAAALLLFLLVSPLFGFFLQPVAARLSRKHEFEADDFAAAEADAQVLIRALVKLYRENAATLTPDPLYSAFHDSHPPAPVRVAHLSALAAKAR